MIPANTNNHPILARIAPALLEADTAGLRAALAMAAGLLAHATTIRDTRNVLRRIGEKLRGERWARWTEGEINIIRRFYRTHSDKEIANALRTGGFDRSWRGVLSCRMRLGLYRHESRRPASRMAAE